MITNLWPQIDKSIDENTQVVIGLISNHLGQIR